MEDLKPNILYVDDEKTNRLLFKSVFENDYNVVIANSGKEGLGILNQQRIEVIITDQRMPQMTGVEFLQEAIKMQPSTYRIILTAYSEHDVLKDAVNKGEIFKYLQKPWKKEDLKPIIDQALFSLQLKFSEETLRESEAKYKDIVELGNIAIVVDDIDGKLLYFNKQFS